MLDQFQSHSKPYSFERLTKTYRQSPANSPAASHELIVQDVSSTNGVSTVHSNPRTDELYYDEYLRLNYPDICDQPLIKESTKVEQRLPSNHCHFTNFFKTSAVRIKPTRERQYLQSRQRVQRSQKMKIEQLNHYQEVEGLEQFLQDHSWKWVKGRPQGCDFSVQEVNRRTIFDEKKALSNDERRFNNFNTKNFEIKIRVPNIDKYSARKPLLNNMETPLVYYDKIGEVYQKITFGETMQKCLFDYAKSARKEKQYRELQWSVIDLKAELTVEKKPPFGFMSRAQVLEMVRKQEIIDHNIERMRNRLAINKAYPTPLFDKYMPRTRPSSHQLRWVKLNSNHFEDYLKKEELDSQRISRNRSRQRNISPSDWKLTAKKMQSRSLANSPFKMHESQRSKTIDNDNLKN